MLNNDFVDFKKHLLQIIDINETNLEKLISEINEFYSIDIKDFVKKRHTELKIIHNFKNDKIYEIIAKEIEIRRFPIKLSERQIRRYIYG